MKKNLFYYLLMLLPLAAIGLVSCDDDTDKIPDVGVEATISGGVFEDGQIYVTQGSDLTIDALKLLNRSGKDGAIGAVTYRWNGLAVGSVITEPFTFTYGTAEVPVGTYVIEAEMPIYVVDYPLCWASVRYRVNIVAADDDLPADGTTDPVTAFGTVTPNPVTH